MQKLAAWSVHAFTATGLLAAFMGLIAVSEGDYRLAMLWILVALVIDGVDGTFARLARVGEVLPRVSGKTIDYVIDFFSYAILPAYLFYEAMELAYWPRLTCCFAMLLSAALYYGKEDMVSPSGRHFVGFPVLWNMVVYVLVFVLPWISGWAIVAVVFAFAVMHFLPVLFAYPSRGGRWWVLTLLATVAFIAAAVMNVWYYPEPSPLWRGVCLVATAYYAVLAAVDTYSGDGAQVP
ncbi:phosphatidylcholine synthase [Neolewinella xylanilytica]|uniref:Phosphatidylcholine synthase n=1 Tax=Neolewinella xylanilytica TaxID=1514080 RepID=A0A2S6I3S5_9BACT|nr:CDP-alcohol phosphatidyltransferase family protein [Neolewinella xylanilytica]PPK85842.1 phosphatidylcholine synthase [Neolewinella xylanilytica]